VIKVHLVAHPLDPHKTVSNLLARVFREFAEEKKLSTVIEVHCKPEDPPVRLQLRVLVPKILKGASRQKRRPRMTRSTTRST
jgi:hypothetical protein